MATLFVLDVPEFAPLVAGAENAGARLARKGDYHVISAEGEIAIARADTGMRRAVWFGALTGGFVGCIRRFDDDALVIEQSVE